MGIALVIKNANFEANKIGTISFSDIPCTGLSIDHDAYTVTSADDPAEVVATVTPNDCTDALLMSVADETVAVINNGIITPVGIGETTLTVRCGTYTVTASVTVPYIDVPLTQLGNYRVTKAGFGGEKDPLRIASNTSYDVYAIPYENDEIARGIYNGANDPLNMVAFIPNGAVGCELHFANAAGSYGVIYFTNAKTEPYDTICASYINRENYTDYNSDGISDSKATIPEGADSLAVSSNHTDQDANMFVRFS